jgi:hypothetical protein
MMTVQYFGPEEDNAIFLSVAIEDRVIFSDILFPFSRKCYKLEYSKLLFKDE